MQYALKKSIITAALIAPLISRANAPKPASDDWMQNYYLAPSPEKFVDEISKLQQVGALKRTNAIAPLAAFISCLYKRATPEQLKQWDSYSASLSQREQYAFLLALHWADTPTCHQLLKSKGIPPSNNTKTIESIMNSPLPSLKDNTHPAPHELDMCWASFFATGDDAYAITVIKCAATPEKKGTLDMSKMAAGWSLNSLRKSHKKIQQITDAFLTTAPKAQHDALLLVLTPKKAA